MTKSITDDWPGFAEELGRKTLEQVNRYVKAREARKITRRELFLIVNALYDSTSGLAPKEVSDLLADLHKEIVNEPR